MSEDIKSHIDSILEKLNEDVPPVYEDPEPIKMFPVNRPDRVPKMKTRDATDCPHKFPVIDDVLRRVECSVCGETLDPIELLIRWAKYDYKLDERVVFIKRFENERAERNAEQNRVRLERDEKRRKKCLRCNKLFKPVPVNGCFSHWGICDPCWEAERGGMVFPKGPQ